MLEEKGLERELISERELLVRAEDVPYLLREFTQRGKEKVLGVTGLDLLCEASYSNSLRNILFIYALKGFEEKGMLYGGPTLCLLSRKFTSIEELFGKGNEKRNIAISQKYRRMSKIILNSQANNFQRNNRKNPAPYSVDILNGSLEELTAMDLYDACIDIVCTGKSMKKAGLKVIKQCLNPSPLVLVGTQKL
jgi:ATP phosphoribosyltransferase